MRLAILFVLGLAVGAFAAANVVNTLRQRDAYPRGMMNVMQHDLVVLRADTRAQRCDAQAAASLEQLRGLANGIETAVYGDDPPDPPFAEYAKRLRNSDSVHARLQGFCAGRRPPRQRLRCLPPAVSLNTLCVLLSIAAVE